MGGCCLLALLLLLGPRILLVVAWLFTNWYEAFGAYPWMVAFLGWLFLPYTSMAWMFIYFQNQGQIEGGYLVMFILAILFDIGVFGGSHKARRQKE